MSIWFTSAQHNGDLYRRRHASCPNAGWSLELVFTQQSAGIPCTAGTCSVASTVRVFTPTYVSQRAIIERQSEHILISFSNDLIATICSVVLAPMFYPLALVNIWADRKWERLLYLLAMTQKSDITYVHSTCKRIHLKIQVTKTNSIEVSTVKMQYWYVNIMQ